MAPEFPLDQKIVIVCGGELGERCGKAGLLWRDLSPKSQCVFKMWPPMEEAEVEKCCGRIKKRFFTGLDGWHGGFFGKGAVSAPSR